jgi:uncharacterized phage-associated protein
MKKILFAIFAVAALVLTGCENKGLDIMSLDANKLDNTEFTCWKYTVKRGGLFDGTMYAWDTEANVVRTLQEIYKQSKNKAIVTYERTPADDKEGCEAQNNF